MDTAAVIVEGADVIIPNHNSRFDLVIKVDKDGYLQVWTISRNDRKVSNLLETKKDRIRGEDVRYRKIEQRTEMILFEIQVCCSSSIWRNLLSGLRGNMGNKKTVIGTIRDSDGITPSGKQCCEVYDGEWKISIPSESEGMFENVPQPYRSCNKKIPCEGPQIQKMVGMTVLFKYGRGVTVTDKNGEKSITLIKRGRCEVFGYPEGEEHTNRVYIIRNRKKRLTVYYFSIEDVVEDMSGVTLLEEIVKKFQNSNKTILPYQKKHTVTMKKTRDKGEQFEVVLYCSKSKAEKYLKENPKGYTEYHDIGDVVKITLMYDSKLGLIDSDKSQSSA